ncbi:MAG: hypothetical protein ACTSP1_13810 [Candidatus Freyarchaeota archaeon]
MKTKFVAALFLAAVMIGTGIVVAQSYRLPSSGYTALGVAAVLNHNTAPSDNSQATATPKLTHYPTDYNSLNLTQTRTTRENLQNRINRGFINWMFKSPQRLLRSFNADNETLNSLFFQFMAENPKYQELFKQYDRLLSEEIGVQMMRFANETSKYVNPVIAEGEVAREWNTTSAVNDTLYTYVYRDYVLEINGTTQHVLKVSVYTSDGTLIIDPNLMITQAPLIYWYWWWGWHLMLYGYDYGIYLHFTPAETPIYLSNAFTALVYNIATCSFNTIADYLSPIAFALDLAGLQGCLPAGIAGAVISATVLILIGLGKSVEIMASQTWTDISYVAGLNEQNDPSYGFQLFQRYHQVILGQWWDTDTWITFHLIMWNGGVYQTCPRAGVIYILDGSIKDAYFSFLVWYNANIGRSYAVGLVEACAVGWVRVRVVAEPLGFCFFSCFNLFCRLDTTRDTANPTKQPSTA